MNDPYVLSIVAKGYRLCFTSPSPPPGKYDSPQGHKRFRDARVNISNASEERNLRNISRHSRVPFEYIPCTQGFWRVGSSYRLKTTEPPHHKLSAEYRRKRRLRIQNRSAGFILSCCNPSGQQEVPTFCLPKQGISVSTSLPSEHCPSGIYSLGTHSGSLPPLSGDIHNPVSRQLVDTPPRLLSVFTPPVSVITNTEHGRPH